MSLPHILVFDDIFNFDISDLKDFQWQQFPGSKTPWYSRRVFHESNDVWDNDTPDMCKDAYNISIDLFKKINPECDVVRLVRCMIHKYTPETYMEESDIHRDEFSPDYWSTTFYVDGEGPTDFFLSQSEDSQIDSVEFKKGRVSIFPAGYWHRPSKRQSIDRYVVALTFEVRNLIEAMNGVRPLCTCGKSSEPYCTGMHKP